MRLAESLRKSLGVPVLPAPTGSSCGIRAIELDERVHEMAPDWATSKQLGKLGEIEKPVGVPGRPIRIVPVGDSVDDVVRLRCVVQQVGDPLAVWIGHSDILAAKPRLRID